MDDSPISIVVACDDHYAIMLAALLKSIELNSRNDEQINIYVVDDGISTKSKQCIQASLRAVWMTIKYIPMLDAVPKGITLPVVPNTYPLNTYIRLLIPYFMPPEVTRVLFMDVDMIVLGDIGQLWRTDIGHYPIGAVRDTITRYIGNLDGGGIANYKELGLKEDSPYFNAGLQLINLPAWRAQNLTERIMQCIRDHAKYAHLGDQYGLNAVLADNWYELDPLWNYMANGDHPHPYLIHFIHRKPFYKSYFNNPAYQQVFYDYLSLTAWKKTKPVGESRRYVKKMNNIVQKVRQLF